MFFYGKTDKGRIRATNQDNFLTMRIADNLLLLVLCDGMGGTSGGNIASALAARTYAEYLESVFDPKIGEDGAFVPDGLDMERALREAASAANAAVYERARESSELANMGTTLVSALICDRTVYISNVGDSRMYMYVDGELTQLTHDHSYVQMLVDMGMITREEAATNPRRNILTRAVGTEKNIEVDITQMELPSVDAYFLLCSDGLYNFLHKDDLEEILSTESYGFDDDYEADLAHRTDLMIDSANDNGGGDNITTILVRITADGNGEADE